MSKRRERVPLGASKEKITGAYWVIVTNVAAAPPALDVFVMLPREVKELAHQGTRNGTIAYWLQPKAYVAEEYQDKWDRLKVREA